MSETIEIRGAREHNLKSVDLRIPLKKLTAICGVSGSGKSSLALGVLAAEGRRRYLTAMGDWEEPAPAVDVVDGLPPTIALMQRGPSVAGARPVAQLLEVQRQLHTLWLTEGVMHCPRCGKALPTCNATRLTDELLVHEGQRLTVLAPILRGRDPSRAIEEITRQGFLRVRWNGSMVRLDEGDLKGMGDLDLIIDRIRVHPDKKTRLHESLRTAFAAGSGRVLVTTDEGEQAFATRPYCLEDDLLLDNPSRPGLMASDEMQANLILWDMPWRGAMEMGLAQLRQALAAATVPPTLSLVHQDVVRRLAMAEELGLGHVPLGRLAQNLSSTELRRCRLASLVANPLSGVLLVLDEPTDGLDVALSEVVAQQLNSLVAQGNTVVVPTHDRTLLERADHIIELGPGAGAAGGQVVFAGPFAELREAATQTAAHLEVPEGTSPKTTSTIKPGVFQVITGPPGCGKSRALNALEQGLEEDRNRRVLHLSRGALGKSRFSVVATAAKVWSPIRALLAQTKEARIQGFSPSQFALGGKEGGRCAACRGTGVIEMSSPLVPQLVLPCDDCGGRRFDSTTLSVTYRGMSAHDLLEMTVVDARTFFSAHRKIGRPLDALCQTGLGYLPLGQPSDTLSGGEAQRVRLARELARAADPAGTFAFLDTPSSGLHPADLVNLLDALVALVDRGMTLVAADVHPMVVARATWQVPISQIPADNRGKIEPQAGRSIV